jgi:hypothetical protein
MVSTHVPTWYVLLPDAMGLTQFGIALPLLRGYRGGFFG